jgi:hypothetical protein
LEVAAAAYDDDGRMLNGLVETSDQSENAASLAQNAQGIYRVQQQLDIPLAATSIRIAVRDVSTDHIGALEIPLPLAPETQNKAAAPAQPAAPSLGSTSPN